MGNPLGGRDAVDCGLARKARHVLSTLSGVRLELGGDMLERVALAAVQEVVAGLGRTFLGMPPIVREAHSDAQVARRPV
jgi:hypothetical protein